MSLANSISPRTIDRELPFILICALVGAVAMILIGSLSDDPFAKPLLVIGVFLAAEAVFFGGLEVVEVVWSEGGRL